MDHIFHTHFHHPMITKTLVHFILPLSIVFSLLFSIFSIGSILSDIYIHYLPRCFPTALILHLSDRNCMFLVCNGILVILAKNLKLNGTFPSGEIPEMKGVLLLREERAEYHVEETPLAKPELLLRGAEEDQENEVKYYYCPDLERGVEEIRSCLALENGEWEDEDEDDEEENILLEGNNILFDEEEINDAHVSTEELNKKFEEFIRRMKEEIRIQAMDTML